MNSGNGNENTWTDERIGEGIAQILRLGAAVAVFIVSIGSAIYLWRHGLEAFDYGRVPNEQLALTNVSAVLSSSLALHGRGIIQLGLLVLIATPIARVAFSVFAFAKQQDRAYVIITAVVLAVLCYSLFAS